MSQHRHFIWRSSDLIPDEEQSPPSLVCHLTCTRNRAAPLEEGFCTLNGICFISVVVFHSGLMFNDQKFRRTIKAIRLKMLIYLKMLAEGLRGVPGRGLEVRWTSPNPDSAFSDHRKLITPNKESTSCGVWGIQIRTLIQRVSSLSLSPQTSLTNKSSV